MILVDCNPSLPRDDLEYLLTIGLEIISEHHDGIQEALLVVLRDEDEIVHAAKHILVVLKEPL